MKELHATQKQLLDLLKANIDEPLTVVELMEIMELSSTSVVHYHITQLEKKGYLKRNPGNPRDYQILGDPEKPITYLNFYGTGQCGPHGLVLDGSPLKRIPMASSLINFPVANAYMLQAKGDSMKPKIVEGDYVIVEKANTANDGDVIVCVNEGVVLIKQYLVVGSHRVLQSFNSDHKRIVPGEGFKIEGVVKGVFSYSF